MELLMLRVVNAARQLRRPVREDYVPPVEKIQNILSESALSKQELLKPAGKGPNSGIPRIQIFADKISKGEDHLLNDGSSIKITKITMNGKIYGVKDMNSLVKDYDDVETVSITEPKTS